MVNWNEWIEAVRKIVEMHDKDMATWLDFSEDSSWKKNYYDDEYTPQEAFDEEMSYYYD